MYAAIRTYETVDAGEVTRRESWVRPDPPR